MGTYCKSDGNLPTNASRSPLSFLLSFALFHAQRTYFSHQAFAQHPARFPLLATRRSWWPLKHFIQDAGTCTMSIPLRLCALQWTPHRQQPRRLFPIQVRHEAQLDTCRGSDIGPPKSIRSSMLAIKFTSHAPYRKIATLKPNGDGKVILDF